MSHTAYTRRSMRWAAILNLGYFWIEFAVAIAIGSVSLLADSIDFLEDASLNFLVLFALGWSAALRARVGMLLAAILLIPATAALCMAWTRLTSPIVPEAMPLSLTGLGALGVNFACAWMLHRHRHSSGSLVLAAFLSARNDVIANIAIIAAGLATAYSHSGLPDLIVGLGIGAMNIGAARQVYAAANRESDDASGVA